MKQQLLGFMAFSAACFVLGAQDQTSPQPGAPGSPGTPGTPPRVSSGQPGDTTGRISPTGRMGTQGLRASKLIGAEVKSASGESLGKIEDVLINPMSGRIDFAVLSYQGSVSASPGAPATTSTSAGGKLLPLPWSYLRASGLGSGAPASSEQMSFVFAGDKSKLENAPSFDQSNWPDVSQPEWRQRIFSHYGMPGTSTGGATAPGGAGSSSSSPAGTPPQNPRPGSPTPQ